MERAVWRGKKAGVLTGGLLIACLVTIGLLFGLAFLMLRLRLSPDKTQIGIMIIYAVSCFFGGLFTGKHSLRRKFFWGMMTGLLYFILLFLLSQLRDEALTPAFTRSILACFCCCLGGMLGGMLAR